MHLVKVDNTFNRTKNVMFFAACSRVNHNHKITCLLIDEHSGNRIGHGYYCVHSVKHCQFKNNDVGVDNILFF